MPDRHKMDAIPYRPAAPGDLAWLREHAAATGRAVVDVLRQAVAEYRARHDQGQEQR